MYRTWGETQWTVREDLDIVPSRKRKKYQFLPKLKKKISGRYRFNTNYYFFCTGVLWKGNMKGLSTLYMDEEI